LKVIEKDEKPQVVLSHSKIELHVRPGTSTEKRQEVLDDWYRKELKKVIPGMIRKWEKKMGVTVNEFGVKKMRTRWGTCNPEAKRIWLNLELAKKPPECLEYIVVHEMVHLLERSHNERFIKYMNEFMPKWKFFRDELNRLPFRHVEWNY
ncbi:MAG: M48 family metallopeptidase, partial [Bacteroidales bacterium]|nr:M48 family metallopeptidase [Bacteroidales bacterium]